MAGTKGAPEPHEKGGRRKSAKSGLILPVGRINRQLVQSRKARQVSIGSGIFLTATLEYLTAEIMQLAGNAALDEQKAVILPRHIQKAF
mmetsp:Transcript_9676/g.13211  ORF Transcript_9676/g.13211 Transcript_9676/m.13211 type:complete len:89 (-) Transcript_9676:216-482(-)|eukprot:CAMPEP_0170457818 /NCGR_PEP_ID=MMETSP0123-20130129/4977_1 /TAXON_ID=182087 /ORGANISM="Favella ehrenbergii, Strain Fehren 1" /LENGTH=88 /DNA_ID=CAMNT_0010721725 /DNA_START=38 /DNA_END=304 /DNA_ORIENTATION=+